ncbi:MULTISPECIES: DUF779 domain-containing protein [Vitreoscilla]|uniref:DUF779 domain-containing protein n=1 Tax=Vitreoscilla stercoraria TaxID=61 RepID=A0ABY4EB72_VITST|nr:MULTISPECIES: DUF779 domain-containing protein [Vitreoscilla]AUZ06036.2 hypothetical protein ADP71_27710 [Vitreoscilla sp. C1]UOO92593.1 DUF779 domain-containing protein [Vitreoscilla stercoraria]
MSHARIAATPAALDWIAKLTAQHGPLMFHQSGGCCDGSAPMCFPLGEFKVGAADVWLGDVGEVPFYMSVAQFEYWQHTHLTLDVVEGRGASFSLEIPEGVRFIIRSRLFTEEETKKLSPIRTGISEEHG